jgi:hypothetical protein
MQSTSRSFWKLIIMSVAVALGFAQPIQAQDVGATFGFNYETYEMTGPYPANTVNFSALPLASRLRTRNEDASSAESVNPLIGGSFDESEHPKQSQDGCNSDPRVLMRLAKSLPATGSRGASKSIISLAMSLPFPASNCTNGVPLYFARSAGVLR